MMKKTIGLCALLSLVSACSSTQSSATHSTSTQSTATQPTVTHYQTKGNLSHSQPLGCASLKQISSNNNPVDIFSGAYRCIEAGKYAEAADMYYVAMNFGYFDKERVADSTAHQAISVLRMNIFGGLSEQQKSAFQSAVKAVNTESICAGLAQTGKPTYKPTYMIQHGMSAFLGQSTKDGLVENFDATTAWNKTISTLADCKISG